MKSRRSRTAEARKQVPSSRAEAASSSAEQPTPRGGSGQIPTGDVRLTANISSDLHLALKIRAARERTTMGELIEDWVSTWKEDV